jgi:dTDP-4-amino-4,6-dideoxygalactose transaminase
MDYANEIYEKRLRISKKYDRVVESIPWLVKQANNPENQHGYQSYVCLFKPEEITIENVYEASTMRNKFMDYLLENGIMTRPGTHAIHTLNYYERTYKYKPTDFPKSLIADRCSIAFPLYPSLSDGEFDYIAEKIIKYKVKL